MKPQALTTWVQISVPPQRHVVRRRRRRIAALLARSAENTGTTGTAGTARRAFTVPAPRMPVPPSVRRV